jgi:rod shape-determining protein MreD
MFIVIFSLLFKNKEGIIFAITSGIVLDLTMSRIIGINTLVFFEVSIILYYLRNIIYSGNMITIVSISVLSTVLYYINSILLNYFLLIRSFSLGVIIKIMIIESIMNAFSAILIYKIMPKKFIINEVKKV